MITVIYTIRDRDHRRIKESVESMRNSSSFNFNVIVVDYGSKAACSDKVKELCLALELNYIRVETEGLPWNKSHAINIGARNANTKFIVITDIDMLFEGDILSESLNSIGAKMCSIVALFGYLEMAGKIKQS
jgi:glycosyltransferase involved in cell wall biosynthesis